MDYVNYLCHHGVLGMKWGVRRYQNADGSLTPRGIKRYGNKTNFEKVQRAKLKASGKDAMSIRRKKSAKVNARVQKELDKYKQRELQKEERKNAKAHKKEKKAPVKKSLTSEELRSRIDRLNLEKEYREKNTSRGRKVVGKILESSINNIGTQTTTYLMGTGVNKILKQITGDPNAINPKKGQKDK